VYIQSDVGYFEVNAVFSMEPVDPLENRMLTETECNHQQRVQAGSFLSKVRVLF